MPEYTTHDLKCWPEFFDAVESGRKTFEVRKNDRGYQAGDVLVLRKFDPRSSRYLLRGFGEATQPTEAATITARVTYVLSGMGIEPGYVVMGIKLEDDA